MRSQSLNQNDQALLRSQIERDGLLHVVERLGVPAGSLTRAAAGAGLLRVTRTAILARLDRAVDEVAA